MNLNSPREGHSSKSMMNGSNSEMSHRQDSEIQNKNKLQTKDQTSSYSFESELKSSRFRNLLKKRSNLANLSADNPSEDADNSNFQLPHGSENSKTNFSLEQNSERLCREKSLKRPGKQNYIQWLI